MKYLFLTILFLIFFSTSGQKADDKYFLSIKDYRDKLVKSISNGDTVKEARCKLKTTEYLNLKRLHLVKVDSMTNVVKELNKDGSAYFYYIIFTKPVYFDWGDCNTEVLKNNNGTITYRTLMDSGEDIVTCKFVLGKEDKFRTNTSGFSTGQTFYREDFK